MMKTFLKRIFKYESPADKFITVNKQANLLHKKEQEIYKKTKEFEKESPLTAGLDYLLYDFQVYCEFIEKYKKQFGLKYDNDFYDLLDNLTLVKRFLEIGYYGSAGMYIRKAFEDWSKMFSTDKSSTKFSELFRNTICLKKSDDGPMQFDSREVYKLYIYLSENYTHCHLNFEDIKFNSKEYFEIKNLLIIIIITICSITLQMVDFNKIKKYWVNKIDNPAEEYQNYANYIRLLTGPTGLCWFENSLKNSSIQDFEFKEQKGLNLEKWIKHSDEIK